MGWKEMSQFALKLHLNRIQGPKRLIGIDIGTHSTGVSISCDSLKKTYLLKVVQQQCTNPKFFKKITHLIQRQEHIKGVIIGKPKHSQAKYEIEQVINEVTKILSGTSYEDIAFCYVDESWTTMQARQKIAQIKQAIRYHGHLHGEKQLEDGIAAMNILDRYLKYYNKN